MDQLNSWEIKREQAIEKHVAGIVDELKAAGWQLVDADASTATVEAWDADDTVIFTYEIEHDSAMGAGNDGWEPVVSTVIRDGHQNEVWLEAYDRLPSQAQAIAFMAALSEPAQPVDPDPKPEYDSSTTASWASTWLERLSWHSRHPLDPAYKGRVADFVIDMGVDLPWTSQWEDVVEAILEDERWPAVRAAFDQAHGYDWDLEADLEEARS